LRPDFLQFAPAFCHGAKVIHAVLFVDRSFSRARYDASMKLNIAMTAGIVLTALTLSARAQTSSSCYTYNNGYCTVTVPSCTTPSNNCTGGGGGTPNVSSVPEPSTWMAGALVALPLAGTFVRILRQRRPSVE
jgi:hypothetical protein